MTEVQRQAIAAIEAQQEGRKRDAAWMIGEQLKDICLLDQTYVRAEDGKQTVAAYLKSVNSALVIKKVVRFEVGEGMEKKNEDFAAEVAKQMAGN
mgnify:CR=1 FL=1